MKKQKWYVLCAAAAVVLMATGCQANTNKAGQTVTASDAQQNASSQTSGTAGSGSLANGNVAGTNYISSQKKITEIPLSSLGKIALSDYSTVNITMAKLDVSVTDENVDSYIEAKLSSVLKDVSDRGAEKDDTVTVDFIGLVDGKSFSGNQGTDYPIVLGSGQMLEDFEAALYGAKAGDKVKAEVTFPDDYTNADVAGKTASYEITVKAVQEPSELNEEFIKEFSKTGATTEAEYREEVRKELERLYQNQLDYSAFSLALDQIASTSTLEPSQAFLSYLYRLYESDRNAYLESMNMSLDDYKAAVNLDDAGLEENLWSQVNYNVGHFMVLRQIMSDQGLDDPEVMKQKAVALASGISGADITEETIDQIYGTYEQVLEMEAVVYDYLKDRIQITYQEPTTAAQN